MQFEFTVEEINYILNVLAERPFKESAAMIQKIQAQAQPQAAQQPAPETPPEVE